jgi:DNA polymerase III subunit delta'
MAKEKNFTFNWPHIGNSHIKRFLEKSILNESVSSAYIMNGPENLGKTTAAYFFAQSLLCVKYGQNGYGGPCGTCPACRSFRASEEEVSGGAVRHSDFMALKLEHDKKNISIEQVRDFIHRLSLTSFLGSYKIGIIKNADALSQEAANALLKILEEPREKVIIILITEDLECLPRTIVSRSQVLEFRPVSTEEIYDYLVTSLKASRSQAKNCARLSLGRPALAVKFLQDKEHYDNHLDVAGVFADFFRQDINARLESVERLLGAKSKGQEVARQASAVIEVWEGVLRDMALMNFNLANLIQHEQIAEKIEAAKNSLRHSKFIDLYHILKEAKANISANVNPGLALENVAIQL